MVNIKKFIDRVSATEGRQVKDLVIPVNEAKLLKDEIVKLIADNYTLVNNKTHSEPTYEIQINGGKW